MSQKHATNVCHTFTMATFIITYKCPISCRMCFFAAGPHRRETLAKSIAFKILHEAHMLGMSTAGIAGGEPFLAFAYLGELIEAVRGYNMSAIVVTNAYWATSRSVAIRKLKALQEKGLKRLQISLDEQHQEYIPIERVGHAAEAALALGFGDVKLLGTSKGNSENFTYKLFHLQQLLGVHVEKIDILDRQRASHKYYADGEQDRVSLNELEHAEELGIPIQKPRGCLSEMMLDVNGDIYPCCNNFVGRIGNANYETLAATVERVPTNRWFKILKEEGPIKLARSLDREQGTNFAIKKYGSWCEVCARIFQSDRFRDLLNTTAVSNGGVAGVRRNVKAGPSTYTRPTEVVRSGSKESDDAVME